MKNDQYPLLKKDCSYEKQANITPEQLRVFVGLVSIPVVLGALRNFMFYLDPGMLYPEPFTRETELELSLIRKEQQLSKQLAEEISRMEKEEEPTIVDRVKELEEQLQKEDNFEDTIPTKFGTIKKGFMDWLLAALRTTATLGSNPVLYMAGVPIALSKAEAPLDLLTKNYIKFHLLKKKEDFLKEMSETIALAKLLKEQKRLSLKDFHFLSPEQKAKIIQSISTKLNVAPKKILKIIYGKEIEETKEKKTASLVKNASLGSVLDAIRGSLYYGFGAPLKFYFMDYPIAKGLWRLLELSSTHPLSAAKSTSKQFFEQLRAAEPRIPEYELLPYAVSARSKELVEEVLSNLSKPSFERPAVVNLEEQAKEKTKEELQELIEKIEAKRTRLPKKYKMVLEEKEKKKKTRKPRVIE